MRFKTAYALTANGTPVANAKEATRKLASELSGFPAALILFFAATDYEPETLAAEMHDAFPGVDTIGCTTAGESVDDRMLNASVVAMAFSREVFDYCEMAVVSNKDQKTGRSDVFHTPAEAMRHLGRKLGHDLINTDYREYVGFMLADKISSFSEAVVEKAGEMTDVIFVGGIAGDDYRFNDSQRIFYQGHAMQSAAILALWKPRAGFSLLKTQAVDLTEHKMVITKADEENRIIWEFDGNDAAKRYADLLGIRVESMDIVDFDGNPLAVTADKEPYVKAIIKKVDDKGLQMFSSIHSGTTQTLTRAGDIYAVTKEVFENQKNEMDGCSAIVHINCSSRHYTLKKRGQVDEFGKIFSGVPSIAFSSYGEIFVGLVAMTSTMILFK